MTTVKEIVRGRVRGVINRAGSAVMIVMKSRVDPSLCERPIYLVRIAVARTMMGSARARAKMPNRLIVRRRLVIMRRLLALRKTAAR